jgi:hypothetical protein
MPGKKKDVKKDTVEDLIEALKQQRDELKVQMHLGSLEAKDEFAALEEKWEHWSSEAKAQSKPMREVIADSAKNVGSAVDLVLDEVKQSYERIKNQLKPE